MALDDTVQQRINRGYAIRSKALADSLGASSNRASAQRRLLGLVAQLVGDSRAALPLERRAISDSVVRAAMRRYEPQGYREAHFDHTP